MKCTYFYDPDTGEITLTVSPAATVIPEGSHYLHSDLVDMQASAKYYVSGGELVERPEMGLAVPGPTNIYESWTINGIPDGCQVTCPDRCSVQVDDGYLTWSSAVLGTFRFVLTCFPYIQREVYADITDL